MVRRITRPLKKTKMFLKNARHNKEFMQLSEILRPYEKPPKAEMYDLYSLFESSLKKMPEHSLKHSLDELNDYSITSFTKNGWHLITSGIYMVIKPNREPQVIVVPKGKNHAQWLNAGDTVITYKKDPNSCLRIEEQRLFISHSAVRLEPSYSWHHNTLVELIEGKGSSKLRELNELNAPLRIVYHGMLPPRTRFLINMGIYSEIWLGRNSILLYTPCEYVFE